MSFRILALLALSLAAVDGQAPAVGTTLFTEVLSAVMNVSYFTHEGLYVSNVSESGTFIENYEFPSSGVVVEIGGNSGCSFPLVGEYGPIPNEPWIAFMDFDGCDAQTKVINAQRSKAAGVILFKNGRFFDIIKARLDPGIRLAGNTSAVLMDKWEGQWLKNLLSNGRRVILDISIGQKKILDHVSRTAMIMVGVSVLVLTVLCIFWLATLYFESYRERNAKIRLSKQMNSATKKTLKKIPLKTLNNEDKLLEDGTVCSVCIDPYAVEEKVRALPCSHHFHVNCIDPWLSKHRTCPLCKMDILKYYGYTFTGSQESILSIDTEDEDLNNERGGNNTPTNELNNSLIRVVVIRDGDESS